MNYERQKEIDRQKDIDKTRKVMLATAIATKEAVEESAKQTKLARIEQNEAFKRQEKIAEENNFRNTLLRSIQFVRDDEINDYIIQQISKRIPGIKNGQLNIESDVFYAAIETESKLEEIISEIRKTEDCKVLIKKIGEQKDLKKNNEIPLDKINESIKTSKIKMRIYYYLAIAWGVLVVISVLLLLINGKLSFSRFFGGLIKANIPTFVLGFLFLKHRSLYESCNQFLNNEEYINPAIEKIKSVVVRKFIESDNVKFVINNRRKVAEFYFEKFVFPIIIREQSFLPPHCQVGLEFWKNSVISNKTLDSINVILNSIESDVSERFNRDWVYSYRMGFFSESKTVAQSYRDNMKNIIG